MAELTNVSIQAPGLALSEKTVSTEPWSRRATLALVEAQTMSNSIAHLVEEVIHDGQLDSKCFGLLEAVTACLLRMDRLVDPAVESAPNTLAEVAHG